MYRREVYIVRQLCIDYSFRDIKSALDECNDNERRFVFNRLRIEFLDINELFALQYTYMLSPTRICVIDGGIE